MPNPSATIGPGQWAALAFQAVDGSGNPGPSIHGTIQISDYTKAYVTGTSSAVGVLPKVAAPAGGSFVVSATVTAFDADGNPLPLLQFDVTVQGPPAPPLAVSLVPGAVTTALLTAPGTPPDPGSASITF
jgi:hypothetical protein